MVKLQKTLFFCISFCLFALNMNVIASEKDLYLRYNGRHFVANVLKNIYGPNSESLIDSIVVKNSGAYGGPCDLYSTKAEDSCNEGVNESRLEISIDSGALRAFVNNKVCTQLYNCKSCNRYIEKKMHLEGHRWPSSRSKKWIVELFYPNQNQAALNVIETSKSDLRSSLLFLCRSGTWQIL
jgi:hypothetical protein